MPPRPKVRTYRLQILDAQRLLVRAAEVRRQAPVRAQDGIVVERFNEGGPTAGLQDTHNLGPILVKIEVMQDPLAKDGVKARIGEGEPASRTLRLRHRRAYLLHRQVPLRLGQTGL